MWRINFVHSESNELPIISRDTIKDYVNALTEKSYLM